MTLKCFIARARNIVPTLAISSMGAAWLVWPAIVLAQTTTLIAPSRPFASVEKTDLAQAWLDYFFRGDALPDAMAAYAAPLAFAADGLREALGLYSVGILMLAAMLVFYHLAAMVAETAHSGVPFGRRANQIWMPIRFVLAIGLLVPVGSSLSVGQHIVIKIAEEGSALASNAWRTIASVTNGHLSGLVTPHGPDVAHLVATAVEMETCHTIYQQLYAPLDNDAIIHMAGPIGDMAKLPADRFTTEIWRYSNMLNADVPLCGEYRFSGYRRPLPGSRLTSDAISHMAQDLSVFARSQTDALQTQARVLGDRVAAAFLNPVTSAGADIRSDLAGLEVGVTDRLNTERQQIGAIGAGIADQTMADSTDAGWIAAASFIPEFVRLQESYSELIDHALPVAQSPVFAHPRIMQKVLADALAPTPAFVPLEGIGTEKLIGFYNQVSRVATQVHFWLANSQLPDKDFVAPASADLRRPAGCRNRSRSGLIFFARAFDAAALAHGVWGEDPDTVDTGYPFTLIPSTTAYNPFAALVEFGRRQTDLASELAGLAGSGITVAGATGPSVLFGMASFCFFLGGITLIFIVPLLPFLRFLMAALAWAVNVFEAVVAVPIVALAHLTPVGGGLSGSLARQAYMLWLGLLVRPVLTLFGFVFGLLLFALSLAFIDAVLMPFARLAMPSDGGLLIVANAGLVILYDVLAYAAANASFKAIHWLPDQALRWTSNFVVTDRG